jgi:DNA invertase Pin-like site-specific DNA recombinase
MVLTREEKDKLIRNLYDQGKTYKEIAKEARVSVRDIKPTLERKETKRELELGTGFYSRGEEEEEKNW